MGRRGPPPTPTHKLRLAGSNRAKYGRRDDEPTPKAGRPTRPAWITGEARKEWERVTKELAEIGLLAKIDRALLAAYCQSWKTYVEATKAQAEKGLVVKSPSGYPMHNPYLAIANKALDQVKTIAAEFGLSPSARTRVKPTEKKTPKNGKGKFFTGA